MKWSRRSPLGFALLAWLLWEGEAVRAGTLYFSEDTNSNGLYSLNTSDGSATLVGAGITTVVSQSVGLAPSSSHTSLWGSQPLALLSINADGSGAVATGTSAVEGLAFDPHADTLYYSINGDFGTQHTGTGALSPLASPGFDVEGLAFGNGGVYGLADGGNLLFYNPGADSWSLIGNTDITFDDAGLAFDPGGNLLYAVGDQDSNLYSIDPVDATTAVVGNTGIGEGGGLAFVAIPEPSTLWLGVLAWLSMMRRRRLRSAR